MEQSGLAQIEWVILMALVVIIAAIAIPSYQRSVLRSHRSYARTALTNTAKSLKICHSRYGNYKTPACSIKAGQSFPSPHGFYTISVKIPNDKKFTLIAAARGNQKGDRTCEDFFLNQAGLKQAKSAKDVRTSTTCW